MSIMALGPSSAFTIAAVSPTFLYSVFAQIPAGHHIDGDSIAD